MAWMENNEALNSKMTIFIKYKVAEYIIHGLFVDDMMHIYSCDIPGIYRVYTRSRIHRYIPGI